MFSFQNQLFSISNNSYSHGSLHELFEHDYSNIWFNIHCCSNPTFTSFSFVDLIFKSVPCVSPHFTWISILQMEYSTKILDSRSSWFWFPRSFYNLVFGSMEKTVVKITIVNFLSSFCSQNWKLNLFFIFAILWNMWKSVFASFEGS